MKKIISVIVVFFLAMVAYIYIEPIKTSAQSIIFQSPCDTPRTFRIGSIDPKYKLTEENFIADINNAGEIWSMVYGKNIFKYDPKGDIQINLVYDQRSLLNSEINDLNSKVKHQQSQLDPKIQDYKNRTYQFRTKLNQLNNDIDNWNTKGGAPEDEYNNLISRQKELQQESQSLKAEAISLNQSTDEFNAQVGQLHQTVDNFNHELNYKPEEGEYIFDNGAETINIYFDNTEKELIHTLAHELGHALGIQHNNDQFSIMYPKTTSAVSLSNSDKNDLNIVCKKQNILSTILFKIIKEVQKIKNQKTATN